MDGVRARDVRTSIRVSMNECMEGGSSRAVDAWYGDRIHGLRAEHWTNIAEAIPEWGHVGQGHRWTGSARSGLMDPSVHDAHLCRRRETCRTEQKGEGRIGTTG